MTTKYSLLGIASALTIIVIVGCGQSQQQTDATKTEGKEVASTPSEPAKQESSVPSTVSHPTQQPTTNPAATNPATTGTSGQSQPTKPTTQEPQAPKMVTVPSGTMLVVALETRLRTDSNATGDEFRTRTTEAIRVNDVVVIPAGSEVRGRLTNVEEPHRTAGKAQMTLAFEEFVDPSGKSHAISAMPISLEGEGDKISDEEKVAAGAVIGGVIGALTSKKKTKGAATGAVAGAAAAGAVALATKGKQLDLSPGQQFSIELTAPIEVPVSQLTAGK